MPIWGCCLRGLPGSWSKKQLHPARREVFFVKLPATSGLKSFSWSNFGHFGLRWYGASNWWIAWRKTCFLFSSCSPPGDLAFFNFIFATVVSVVSASVFNRISAAGFRSLPCSEWGLLALGLEIRSVVNTLLFGGLANLRTRYCAPGGHCFAWRICNWNSLSHHGNELQTLVLHCIEIWSTYAWKFFDPADLNGVSSDAFIRG